MPLQIEYATVDTGGIRRKLGGLKLPITTSATAPGAQVTTPDVDGLEVALRSDVWAAVDIALTPNPAGTAGSIVIVGPGQPQTVKGRRAQKIAVIVTGAPGTASGIVSKPTKAELDAVVSNFQEGATGIAETGVGAGEHVKRGGVWVYTGPTSSLIDRALTLVSDALGPTISELSAEAKDYAESAQALAVSQAAAGQALRESGVRETGDAISAAVVEALSDRMRSQVQYGYDANAGLSFPASEGITHIFWIWGQSLALGATSGPILAGSPLYPAHNGRALMPVGGSHTYGGVSGLTTLTEGLFLSVIFDTFASSLVYHLLRDLDALGMGANAKFIVVNSSKGSQSMFQISRGSVTYQQGLTSIRSIVEGEAALNRRCVVDIIGQQGENDLNIRGNTRDFNEIMFRQTSSADIKATTGQVEEPILYMMQVNGTLGSAASTGQRLQMAQLMAAEADPFVCQVGSHYDCQGSANDVVHKSALGANQTGQKIARAVLAKRFGQGYRTPKVTAAYRTTATRILLEVHIPYEPLVLDTTGTVVKTGGMCAAPGYGIDVYDAAGNRLTLSSVSILRASTDANNSRPPTIAVDLAAAPAVGHLLVTVAGRRDDGSENELGINGLFARSLFRDSADQVSLIDGSLQRNWLAQSFHRIPV